MTSADTATLTTMLVLLLVWLLVGAGLYVWYAWALSRLFKSLGTDGWRGWVPVINEMTIFERGGVPAWNVVFYFVPVINLYALYLKFVATGRIGQHFGRTSGFALLGALLTPVWATILVLQRKPNPVVAQERITDVVGHRHLAGGLAPTEQPAAPQTDPPAQPTPAAPAGPPTPPAPTAPAGLTAPAEPPTPPTSPASSPADPRSVAPVQSAGAAQADAGAQTPPPPPTPMPEPAPPEAPVPSGIADSAPILVHNPWARPPASGTVVTEPATTSPPSPDQVPAWLDNPASASAAGSVPTALPLDEDDDGETIVVDRRPRVQWHLNVDNAAPLPLAGEHVVLGRRPASTAPGIDSLAVPDTTRTLSKSHARLDLVDGEWTITDLNSTNGVLITDDAGEESLITPGEAVPVPGRFVLGKVGMHISFEQEGA